MDVFRLRERIIEDYSKYIRSFIAIRDEKIRDSVKKDLEAGLLWPDPLLQLNPAFEWGGWIDDLVNAGTLHPACAEIFRVDKSETNPQGRPMRLYQHQADAIKAAQTDENYVLTTGTGSGKSLSYIIPIVDHILRHGVGQGIKAIIVYPMNALANSQALELDKFLCALVKQKFPIGFMRYTGQDDDATRQSIIKNPPDILLTNYVMLELILTRPYERKLVEAARPLKFLVFDELHTYRGRQGADVALLIRRLRNTLTPVGTQCRFQCVGTSATLAGSGTLKEQKQKVARIASKLFGAQVMPTQVIVESLRQETQDNNTYDTSDFYAALRNTVLAYKNTILASYEDFIRNPLPVWIERTLGTEKRDDSLVRCTPRTLSGTSGAAHLLAEKIAVDVAHCKEAIEQTLLQGYSFKHPDTGKPALAFKLHQFLSKGDTVYATAEAPHARFITLHGQQFAPEHDNDALLFPLQFCRECGQEYYSVWRFSDKKNSTDFFTARNHTNDATHEGEAGYLYITTEEPWPDDIENQREQLPDDWLTEKKGRLVIVDSKRKYMPEKMFVLHDGKTANIFSDNATVAWFIPTPFVLCLNPDCSVSHSPRVSDFSKLATLGTEGRSTATSVLSMSAVRHLRQEKDLPPNAQKLLCFTDNRQDASLQAGHFNDFVEIGLIRSALCNALHMAGDVGLEHDVLAQKVFLALGLGFETKEFPAERFSVDPLAKFSKADNIRKAFWHVLAYRIYSDLRRGWRIVAPNLEQCGLLRIEYRDAQAICDDEETWRHNVRLAGISATDRMQIVKMVLDYLRSHLAIKVDYLRRDFQDSLRQQSSQYLIDPWKIDEYETMHYASIAFPCAKQGEGRKTRENIFISARSGLGRRVRNFNFFEKMSTDDAAELIHDIFMALSSGGLVEAVMHDTAYGHGYQIPASAMLWKAGDGTQAQANPLRTRYADKKGGRTNPFFVELYRNAVSDGTNLEAKEHTAQVFGEIREERERDFREATLPILYCSPTMELGVDIAQLNMVLMRNIPPTPANYAQRSGRAGRSGQPALIISYCAQGSAHDQHFFKNPTEMVAGSVATPRLDLANEDLIRAHIHALWLSESGLDLKKSLKELLEIGGEAPSLALLPSVIADLTNADVRYRALQKARVLLHELSQELQESSWFAPAWLDDTFARIERAFEEACERWRSLYRAAATQRDVQNAILRDASRSQKDREQAQRLRKDAERQIDLLIESRSKFQSDFYSYRYFASEGFLPGYNFPRLPLSAYIPGKAGVRCREEYISRPRFLAISEFGPGSFIYHEGSRYLINRVIMEVQTDDAAVSKVKQCGQCGYIHPMYDGGGFEFCEMCGGRLPAALDNLFRMRNVATRRRDRINSDEEERMRFGYTLCTGFRFAEHGGMPAYRLAEIFDKKGKALARLSYGHSAQLWRINLGWAHKSRTSEPGFILDCSKGIWVKEGKGRGGDTELEDAGHGRVQRVIPYVEDRKNCLLFTPMQALEYSQMLSLQTALKQGMQRLYQLEEFELAAETLPAGDEPHALLFYESAEGGAGVLRRLVDEAQAMENIAREALSICHFDNISGADLHKAPHAADNCVVACYDCLLSYGNQRSHSYLNRHCIKEFLLSLATARVALAPSAIPRSTHLQALLQHCDSELERDWLNFLEKQSYTLPTDSQKLIAECQTRPDFYYGKEGVAIYVDGPYHDFPERQARDHMQQVALEDKGIMVIRFAEKEGWQRIFNKYPYVFGSRK